MSSFHNFGPAPLPEKTTVAELQPGDKFDYKTRPGHDFRDSPVVSVENIGGTRNANDDGTYADGMYRIRHADSDAIGTLYYGHETVYRAKRA